MSLILASMALRDMAWFAWILGERTEVLHIGARFSCT